MRQPLMMIFEDLHWIDSETQTLLNLLADSIASAKSPVAGQLSTRIRHEWGSRTYYTQLRLDPLTDDSADEMLPPGWRGNRTDAAQAPHHRQNRGQSFFMKRPCRRCSMICAGRNARSNSPSH